MSDDGAGDLSFTSPSSALTHYRTLCASLQTQLQSAEDDLRDLRELQDELESELERFEEGERGMRGEVESVRAERDEWKSKYLSALSSHSTTITHMQKELESLRSTERGLREKLREVEVDNDDLEGRERATSSSLADLEARYNKSLERIALLEEDLVGKARLEEECQRARDELRDANEELAITKAHLDRLSTADESNASPIKSPPPTRRRQTPSSPPSSPETPTIDLVQPTPAAARAAPAASSANANASPSKLPRPLSFSSSGALASLAPAPLSRSTRLSHLPSLSSPTTGSPSKLPQPTSTARLTRSDTANMIKEMQAMTGRVRRLTERLDQGRTGPPPRATATGLGGRGSPSLGNLARAGGGGMTRSSTMRIPTASTTTTSTSSRPSSRVDSTRPPSRSALRASIGGSSMRPPSRLSVSSSGTSRAASPTPGARPSSRLGGGLGRSVGPGSKVNPPVTGLGAGLASSVRHVRRQSSTSSSVSTSTTASGRSTRSVSHDDPLRRSTASNGLSLGVGRPSSALGQSQGPGTAVRRASGGFGLLARRVSLANGRKERDEVPPVPRLPGR